MLGAFHLRKTPDRDAVGEGWRNSLAQENGAGPHFVLDALEKGGGGLLVHWNHDHAFQQAAPERGDPARPVFRPDHDGLAFVDGFGAKAGSKGRGHLSHIWIAVGPAAVSVIEDDEFRVDLGDAAEIGG